MLTFKRTIETTGALLLLASFAGPARTEAAPRVTCEERATGSTVCRVDEPPVDQRVTVVPEVQFLPGDRVTVQAGGCVNTAALGLSWKRYVDPVSADPQRYFHGRIQIPGATPGLVRIAGWMGRPLVIPLTTPSTDLSLHLGYEDLSYADNGYSNPDPGTEDQCAGVEPAWVELHIERGGEPQPTPVPSPFDLVWTEVDRNALPLNPEWSAQVADAGSVPDPGALCDNFPYLNPANPELGVRFTPPTCTSQSPWVDIGSGFHNFICHIGGDAGRLKGHANWGAATYEGTLTWVDKSLRPPLGDSDYNLGLSPVNGGLLTTTNPTQIGLEFLSTESIDQFHAPWWAAFREAVDRDDGSANASVDHKPAIVTGLVNLDCEHDCGSELHPVYAMAIESDATDKNNVWAIFARNWGNEGYCSAEQQYLDVPRNALTLRLPWKAGFYSVKLDKEQTFLDTNGNPAAVVWSVTPRVGVGLDVTIQLPEPQEMVFADGELHLQWSTSALGSQVPTWLLGLVVVSLATLLFLRRRRGQWAYRTR